MHILGWNPSYNSRNTKSSVEEFVYQIDRTPCRVPSINAFKPAQSWPYWYTLVASGPVTLITNLEKRRHQVLSTPNGKTPGRLLSAIRRQDTNSLNAAHGGFLLAIQSMEISTLIRSFFLSYPNFNSNHFRYSESVFLVSHLHGIFITTDSTTSSVIYMEMKICVLSKNYKIEHRGIVLCGWFFLEPSRGFLL